MSCERNILSRLMESRMMSDADRQYNNYLDKHRNGVITVYESRIKPVLIKRDTDTKTLTKIEKLLSDHDISKYDAEEWNAYRDHFYDPDKHPKSNSVDYDMAWNRHQKSNPHHWQYWCIINDVDEPQVQALEMPFEYIIEMVCDWQSAGNHYGNTAYDWYMKQRDKMILHDTTRQLVEEYIEYLR